MSEVSDSLLFLSRNFLTFFCFLFTVYKKLDFINNINDALHKHFIRLSLLNEHSFSYNSRNKISKKRKAENQI